MELPDRTNRDRRLAPASSTYPNTHASIMSEWRCITRSAARHAKRRPRLSFGFWNPCFSVNLPNPCPSIRTTIQECVNGLIGPPLSNIFRPRTSSDPEVAVAERARVGILLSRPAEGPLLDWILIVGCLYAVRMTTSVEPQKREADSYVYPDTIKENFNDALKTLSRLCKISDIVAIARGLNAQASKLSVSGNLLGGRHKADSVRTTNE
ncbi:hypothetical protein T265_08882 [Opisthorchis viverrini]|uniref:Uncharacterized protein n=1 Tax=Opisthorchis viverrini TaxID=6198 RepID=A0A075A707_OPIVI|nr:hypothetical protein T265_08882 [Opisthorchis viverrini]KER23189.1 hypothetical protein T265_08882 [Opisthorchis viverrini]